MKINFTSQVRAINLQNNIKKEKYNSLNKSDSFEKTSGTGIDAPNYPQTFKYNPIKNKRKRALEAQQKIMSGVVAEKNQKIKKMKSEFVELYTEVESVVKEIIELSNGRNGLKKIQLKLAVNDNSDAAKDILVEQYLTKAERLEQLILEYEKAQQKLEAFYATEKPQIANIPDLRINLSPENVQYYKQMADFNPEK